MPRQPRRTGATDHPDAELLNDQVISIGGSGAAGHGPRGLARSLPGAIIGSLLVAGLAFGAALGPTGLLGSKGPQDGGPGSEGVALGAGAGTGEETPKPTGKPYVEPTDKPDAPVGTDEPVADPTAKPEPDRTPKPEPMPESKSTPTPTPKPEPKPSTEVLGIAVAIKDGYPVVEWDACDGLDFDAYKVVRSKDSTVAWPAADNDKVIAVVEPGGKRRAWDKSSPDGTKLWYRVFCVRKSEKGLKVVASSTAKGIGVPDRPDPTPPPDPIMLSLNASLTAEGKVALSWSACNVDGFAFYKLVRASHDNPSYFPWMDGSTVMAAIGDRSATSWLDKPAAGQTVYYRVQCLGYYGDGKVLLGQSAVVAVTVT